MGDGSGRGLGKARRQRREGVFPRPADTPVVTHHAAVVFDMDGVVVDSERYWQAIEGEEILPAAVIGDPPEPGAITGMSHLEVYDHLADGHEMAIDEAEFVERYEAAAGTVYGERVVLMTGFEELLAALRECGAALALASSSPHHWIDLVLERFDLADAFDAVVSGEDVPHAKPDPAIYRRTLDVLEVPAERAVAVEDSAHGVAAARAAGMAVVGYAVDPDAGQDLGNATESVETADALRATLLELVGSL